MDTHRAGRDGHVVTITFVVRSDAERTFAALTDPAILSIWFTSDAKADLRRGGRYANADGDRGEFLILDPPKHVAFTWENPAHCPGTEVGIRLSPAHDGTTVVELTHSGLASEADVADMRGGWSWAVDSLKSFLETGRPIAHEDWLRSRREEPS